MSEARDPASFRDPSGFVFRRDGVLYRHVGTSYRDDYERLVDSGLYAALTERGWLVAHEEVGTEADPEDGGNAWRTLRPEVVSFVSYPYEWCFAQLRDAALLTLDVERLALAHGMSLKDASAYNVQFRGSRPVLIDTLSFERYREGRPWVAYRQFCQHFLAPLALASFRDPRTSDLLRAHLDGVPLDLAARLLPRRARLRFGLLSHLFLHAASQRRMAGSGRAAESFRVSRQAREGLVESLAAAVRRLRSPGGSTEWGRYYEATNYDDEAARHKASVVEAALDALAPAEVWDLGANDARFSALASERGIPTVAMDGDWRAVEGAYERSREQQGSTLLPLKIDLTNPSPALGWHHRERSSLLDRGPCRPGAGARPRPPSGDRQQRPATDARRLVRRLLTQPRHRVGTEERLAGRAPALLAGRCLPRLRSLTLRGRLRAALRDRGSRATRRVRAIDLPDEAANGAGAPWSLTGSGSLSRSGAPSAAPIQQVLSGAASSRHGAATRPSLD